MGEHDIFICRNDREYMEERAVSVVPRVHNFSDLADMPKLSGGPSSGRTT